MNVVSFGEESGGGRGMDAFGSVSELEDVVSGLFSSTGLKWSKFVCSSNSFPSGLR